MGFISDLIHRQKEKFQAQRTLQRDIKARVQSGEIKSLAAARKKYERGSVGYKTAVAAVGDEKVATAMEDARLKARIKEAKHPTVRVVGVGIMNAVNSRGIQPGQGLQMGGGESKESPFTQGSRGLDFGGKSKSPFK